MNALIDDPSTSVLGVTISVKTATVISTLASMLNVESLDFSVLPVLVNTRRCLRHAMNTLTSASEPMRDFCHNLDAAIDELNTKQLASPGVAPGFLPANKPALRLLTRLPEVTPEGLAQTVGNLVIISWLTRRPLPRLQCDQLGSLCRAAVDEPSLTSEQTRKLDLLLQRSRGDLLEILGQHLQTEDTNILEFNSHLTNHLRSENFSANPEGQKDANLRRFLSGTKLRETTANLARSMTAGNPEALVALIGFSLNLHWDLLCKVPLHQGDRGHGRLLWLDPVEGIAYMDVRPLLRELGQPVKGCETTKDTIRLPLPRVVSEHLKLATFTRPSACKLGDLIDIQTPNDPSLESAWTDSQRAKLLRSAPDVPPFSVALGFRVRGLI